MKKLVILLFIVAAVALVATYPSAGARAFAVKAMNEAGAQEAHYAKLLSDAREKRDWVRAEMVGEQGYLQTEALCIEIRNLQRIHNECAKRLNFRYTLFTRLGLI